MIKQYRFALVALVAVVIMAMPCQTLAKDTGAELATLVDDYWQQFMVLNPVLATFNGDQRWNDKLVNSIGPEHRQLSQELEQRYLELAESIDPADLQGQDLLTLEIFIRDRNESLAASRFPSHLIPVNQMFSLPIFFVQMGNPGGITPFETVTDYENFLNRIDGFELWMQQAGANLREGSEKGVTQPRILIEKLLPVLASQVVNSAEESNFWAAVEAMPDEFSDDDKTRLTEKYRQAIEGQLIPAYQNLGDYLKNEYLDLARTTIAITAQPDGEAWYKFLIQQNTHTRMTAQEIHNIGLKEVARIEAEMAELASSLGYEGDLPRLYAAVRQRQDLNYTSEENVLETYREIRTRVEPNLVKLFSHFPKADFEVRAVEKFRQATTPGAHYQAATPDGSRPGIFFVNTGSWERRNKATAEALFIHEAVPGHHFQISIARELGELPSFRRFGGYSAYSEGWGLYAESLGKELGIYEDPFQYFGALRSEVFRARRLVVDTGIHALGWTRAEAIDYLGSASEVDRYIAIPGQALSYKIGELKIKELRDRARQKLGEDFDIKSFHEAILADGALPLEVLEAKIDRWIKAQTDG